MMEDKDNEQMKLEVQEWQITNALVGILGILAPAACLAFILGHSGILVDYILNIDYSKPKAPPHHFHRWLTTLIFWPLRHNSPKSISTSQRHKNEDTRNPVQVWRDGSLLCTLVNVAVPGACKDPREHRLQPPKHGVKLVMEYLDIQPIFTYDELNQLHLTPQQEKKFSKYLQEIHHFISKQIDNINNMRHSTDYVARGMGLVIGEQNRKSTFYIYPIPKHNPQPCDLDVTIKGPSGNNGHIVIPSILHHQQKWQQPTEYKRAMYMSSKLNSISPTIQGTSFFRRLSITSAAKPQDPSLEIDIRVKITSTRAKVSYVPKNTGVYEVSLVTRNCHVVGSPYSVPIEKPTSSHYLSNDSDNESGEENEGKYIKRKKKIISKIVDFIDEKMLLQNDGTLVKIESKPELITEKTEINEAIKHKETIFLETDNLREKNDSNKENLTSLNSTKMYTIKTTSQNDPIEEIKNKSGFKENVCKFNKDIVKEESSQKETKVLSTNNLHNNNNNNFEANIIDNKTQNSSFNDSHIKEKSYKHDFKLTLDKFNTNMLQEETNLLDINNKSEIKKTTNKENSKILAQIDISFSATQNKEHEIKNNFEESLTLNEACSCITNNSEPDNNNITFNISKYLDNTIELNYFTEANININNLDDIRTLNNSFCFFAPDILEASNKNDEKSTPFTKIVNEDQISNNCSPKSSLVDSTLFSKVQDPALDLPTQISGHRKTFSKKDPSKELIFLSSTSAENNYLVNNLVKVFDVPQTNTQISDTNQVNYLQDCLINSTTPGNDPDLVQCHITKYSSSDEDHYSIQKKNKHILHEKIKSDEALSENNDKHQCYLKNNIQLANENNNTENHNNVKLGIVDKQKQFWNQKTNNNNEQSFNNNATKQKVILKDCFVVETKDNINNKTNLLCLKPLEGIVENNIKIFETKLISSAPNKKILQLQKSKSESFLQQPKENKILEMQKTLSDEEIIKLPSIEERRKKFLQACQQSFVSDDKKITVQKLEVTAVTKIEDSTDVPEPEIQNPSTLINQVSTNASNETPKPTITSPKKKDKKLSFKRKARFKRAKIFFHHLEGSDPKINTEEHLDSENFTKDIKISRSESDSCVSYNPTNSPIKSLKISDRFQVDDLFQDILGDDKRFIGIPNKMAVVASLASLDSDSCRSGYDFGNDGETNLDYFTGKPKKIKKMKMIPGFHEEYPHLPTTNSWSYKSRNDTEEEELIPGRILLTNKETNLNVT